jgi:4-amino-4-deoxy-L-arabinose transferase-like glycosyltransferase
MAIACDRFTATASCCIFLCVFGFAQLTATANYNFVAPYSHELTHGMALSVGMILCLSQYSLKRKRRWAALAGLLFGLTFLTKPEVFVAAAAAAGVAIFTERKGISGGHLFVGASIAALAAALAVLSALMPAGIALRSVAGTSLFLANTDIVSSVFYKRNGH